MKKHFLSSVFEPASIAVIGASERKDNVGSIVLKNIQDGGFHGDIYPVNPRHDKIGDLPCYPTIKDIDHQVELAVLVIPANKMVAAMEECAEIGVKAAIVLSSGFAEVGARGRSIQGKVVDIARTNNIALVGPNCMGIMRPKIGLNASFSRSTVRQGRTALVAQSGALCVSLLDWADSNGFGFSAFASLGAMAGVGFGEVLDYLAVDPHTESIMLCIEGVSNPRGFLSGLRVAARLKPVIVIKTGRSGSSTRASVAHFGSRVGSDQVFDAAIRRSGAVRVDSIAELIAAARILVSGTRVDGSRLAIVTNGGGPGVMAADRAHDLQVPLAELSSDTAKQLAKVLPKHWTHSVVVDILAEAGPDEYGGATALTLADAGVDGVLVLLTAQATTDAVACADAVIASAAKSRKPVLACWMGARLVEGGRERFAQADIPHFQSPEAGVEAFGHLARFRHNQQALLQAPGPLATNDNPDVDGARLIIEHVLAERRKHLSHTEAKAVVRAFGIPISPSINAHSAADALVAAESLGLPVAMKISSPDIQQKTDVGGVRLNIREPQTVRTAYRELVDTVARAVPDATIQGVTIEPMEERPFAREIMIRVHRDPVFGPVISFGVGGTVEEIFADTSMALPPLNDYLSRGLIEDTRAARYLRQFRHLPAADLDQLVSVLRRVSEIVCELPEIQTLEINPLLVDDSISIATDVRVTIDSRITSTTRYGHMAIHPYPVELVSRWQLSDGTDIVMRPIRPEDALIEQAFVQNLSPESKYLRFMQSLKKLTPVMLARFTQIDYNREMAIIAVVGEGTGEAQVLGVARYEINPDQRSCEFALAIADDMQGQGVGQELMRRLMTIARRRNIEIMEGEVLTNNRRMLALCERLGFHLQREPGTGVVYVRRHLLVI